MAMLDERAEGWYMMMDLMGYLSWSRGDTAMCHALTGQDRPLFQPLINKAKVRADRRSSFSAD